MIFRMANKMIELGCEQMSDKMMEMDCEQMANDTKIRNLAYTQYFLFFLHTLTDILKDVSLLDKILLLLTFIIIVI